MTNLPTRSPHDTALSSGLSPVDLFRIVYLGHAAFCLDLLATATHTHHRLYLDPYPHDAFNGALSLAPLDPNFIPSMIPDGETYSTEIYVATSHDHIDHAATHLLPGAQLIDEGFRGLFSLERFSVPHDEYDGGRRGGQVDVLKCSVLLSEDINRRLTIVFASDMGCTPSPELIAWGRPCDLLIVPIGGYYTIGYTQSIELISLLHPRSVVPMHYLHPGGRLPLSPLGPFLKHLPWRTSPPQDALFQPPHDDASPNFLHPHSAHSPWIIPLTPLFEPRNSSINHP